jgi:hypothetical protein
MRLIDVGKAFATDEQCLNYLERSRWPNGVRCLTCGCDKVSRITRKSKSKNKRAQLYQCLEPTCKQQFSVTTGTIFHDSHLPLHKWFTAIALIVDAKKGMSALQLKRHLGCNYRTAWYLAHRIREAMDEPEGLKLTDPSSTTTISGGTGLVLPSSLRYSLGLLDAMTVGLSDQIPIKRYRLGQMASL